MLEMVSHEYASFGHVIMIHIHILIEWNGDVNMGFRSYLDSHMCSDTLGVCHWIKFYHLTISICYMYI